METSDSKEKEALVREEVIRTADGIWSGTHPKHQHQGLASRLMQTCM